MVNYQATPIGAKKFFAHLHLIHGGQLKTVKAQIDSASTCNNIPSSVLRHLFLNVKISKTKSRISTYGSQTIKPKGQVQYCAKVMQTLVTFLGFLTKKYWILDGSEFSTKSHNNSRSLLFTTMRIFKWQFVWNEKWLRILEQKSALFDKWLRAYERNFALYKLCSNIPKHFVDDNLPSSKLPWWFFCAVISIRKGKLVYFHNSSIRLTWIYFKGFLHCLIYIKSIAALTQSFFVHSRFMVVGHKGHSPTHALFS